MLCYSLEAPHGGTANEYPQHMLFMEKLRKLSKNSHQIFLLDKSSVSWICKILILEIKVLIVFGFFSCHKNIMLGDLSVILARSDNIHFGVDSIFL